MYGKKRSNASQIPKHCLIVFFFSPLCTCYSRTALLSVFLCMHGFLLVFETSSRIHMYPSHLRNAREKKIICVFLYNYSQSVPFPAHFPVHVDFLTVFSSNSQMGIERETAKNTLSSTRKKTQFYHNKLFNYEKQMVGMMCVCWRWHGKANMYARRKISLFMHLSCMWFHTWNVKIYILFSNSKFNQKTHTEFAGCECMWIWIKTQKPCRTRTTEIANILCT